MPNVPAHEKYDDSPSFKKPSGQALALNPYIVENPAGVQFQFVVHFQFVILCVEGEGM
jgi:hypothetical protein